MQKKKKKFNLFTLNLLKLCFLDIRNKCEYINLIISSKLFKNQK